jgi:acyl carrier protein
MNIKNKNILTKQELESNIKKTFSSYFNIPIKHVKISSRLIEDLGMDSFSLLELSFELKEKLGIEIKKDGLININTIGDIVNYVYKVYESKK